MRLLFRFIIAISLYLLSSCSANRYNYYYAELESNTPTTTIGKYNPYYVRFKTKYEGQNMDSAFIKVEMKKNAIMVKIKNDSSLYIDYEKSKVYINDSIHPIVNEGEHNHITPYYENEVLTFQDIGRVDISDSLLYNKYETYPRKIYNNIEYNVNDKNKKIPTIKFNNENTPLKINAKISYYTRPEDIERQTIEFDVLQSGLLKAENIREKRSNPFSYDSEGKEIYLDVESVVYHNYRKTKKIWGWSEIKTGLYWVGYVIAMPFVLIGYTVFAIVTPSEQMP